MSAKITVTLAVTVERSSNTLEEIERRIKGSVEELVKSGNLDLEPEDEIDWRVTSRTGDGVVESIAARQSWPEKCAFEAVEDYGIRDREEIQDHMRSAQISLDDQIANDDDLESFIQQARAELGIEAGDPIDAALAANPEEEDELDV